MKVLRAGKTPRKWSLKMSCTGAGYGARGCGAVLRIGQEDLFVPEDRAEKLHCVAAILCPLCERVTDLEEGDVPVALRADLPSRTDWQAAQEARRSEKADRALRGRGKDEDDFSWR